VTWAARLKGFLHGLGVSLRARLADLTLSRSDWKGCRLMARSLDVRSERVRALEAVLGNLEKQFGKGTIWQLDENAQVEPVSVHPTGCLGLDLALGIGGLPCGRVIEIFGPESSGKTTLMLEVIAGVQARAGTAAYIDAEHALDLAYARNLGVDVSRLLVSQPDSGEQALEIADALARSGAVDLIVIDSVAALVPKAELEGDMGDLHVGLQARLMSQALRKLTSVAARAGCTVVFINQLRMKIGVTFGSPETTTGGNALKFYSSVRIDIRRIGAVKHGEETVGNRTRVKVVKNKLAPPFREAEFDILYGSGINRAGDLLDQAVAAGAVEKSGSWYSFGEERLGQGRDQVCAALRARPELQGAMRDAVFERLGAVAPATAVA